MKKIVTEIEGKWWKQELKEQERLLLPLHAINPPYSLKNSLKGCNTEGLIAWIASSLMVLAH